MPLRRRGRQARRHPTRRVELPDASDGRFESLVETALDARKQEFDDAQGRCRQLVQPAKCTNPRESLISARRVLDLLEWQARRAQASVADDHDAPQPTSE